MRPVMMLLGAALAAATGLACAAPLSVVACGTGRVPSCAARRPRPGPARSATRSVGSRPRPRRLATCRLGLEPPCRCRSGPGPPSDLARGAEAPRDCRLLCADDRQPAQRSRGPRGAADLDRAPDGAARRGGAARPGQGAPATIRSAQNSSMPATRCCVAAATEQRPWRAAPAVSLACPAAGRGSPRVRPPRIASPPPTRRGAGQRLRRRWPGGRAWPVLPSAPGSRRSRGTRPRS